MNKTRTVVTIQLRGKGYICTVHGEGAERIKGVRCGLSPHEAAASAAKMMMEYAQSGGDLMAPPEVLELVPEHLRKIQ